MFLIQFSHSDLVICFEVKILYIVFEPVESNDKYVGFGLVYKFNKEGYMLLNVW